jgi:hypothetical protein
VRAREAGGAANLGVVVVSHVEVLGHAAELVVHLLAHASGPHAGAVVEQLLAGSDVHQLRTNQAPPESAKRWAGVSAARATRHSEPPPPPSRWGAMVGIHFRGSVGAVLRQPATTEQCRSAHEVKKRRGAQAVACLAPTRHCTTAHKGAIIVSRVLSRDLILTG